MYQDQSTPFADLIKGNRFQKLLRDDAFSSATFIIKVAVVEG